MRISAHRARPLALAALLAGGLAAGCASKDGSGDATEATYTLRFPSTEAAVVTDFVKLQVFDATKKPDLCQELVQKRLTQQVLPRPLLDVTPARVCDLFTATGTHALSLTYGERAVLAVGTRKDADFLVGCVQVTAAESQFDIPITLSLVSGNVLPPETTCTSLVDHCGGKC